jgi:hypothetical protein
MIDLFKCFCSKEAAELTKQGIKIIIALGHSGIERDKQIAHSCPEVDLVIGGHCKHILLIIIIILIYSSFSSHLFV